MKVNTEHTASDIENPIPEASHKAPGKDATRTQIRGSSLLLLGKVLSVGINFGSQVLIVRYLSQADYGAWAYALAIVAFFQGFSSLGLKRTITRFVPIYHERDEYAKLYGTIALTLATIFGSCLIIVGAIYLYPEMISRLISGDNQPVNLVLIMIFMVPVEALDGMLIGLFASFANPRAIFTRKFIVGPGIKLAAVLLLIFFGSSVILLAYGYLLGNVIAIVFYSGILFRIMSRQGLLAQFSTKNITIPAREIFGFTIPLLTTDLVAILMHSSDTLILGYFYNTTEVALYQVILPAAQFNKLVMISFALLYTPLAARLFAKNDYKEINNLYWQTAIWMGVLSFPLFALTFSLAKPFTILIYGARYEQSWIFLQLLSLAYYFNVVLGFNGLTLKVLGKLRYVVIINIVAVVINLILNFLFIPRFGALGAAIATALSMIIHNILKQAGLKLASGIRIFEWQYFSYYLLITLSALSIFLVQYLITDNIYVLFIIAMLVSLLVLKLSQQKLKVTETFPELQKIPLIKYLFK